MATYHDLLKYAATGIASPSMTHFDKMRALSMAGGSSVQSITGVPPLSFTGNGKPLISWSMKGNGSQTGTPTPDAPIMPTFCGKLVGSEWEIPITCAGQTTPVYLGEVPTVRRIKKIVVSIDRVITLASGYVGAVTESFAQNAKSNANTLCDVAKYGNTSTVNSFYINPLNAVFVLDAGTALADARELLNGHFIWCILSEPETAIVNEPLCKIGDYSDELISTIPIPTVKGQNLLTVDTDLPPSSMTITGYISQ